MEARIAWRLLKISRRRGAAGAIAAVSVAGVAVAVAAIICVLSVFNGFREVLDSRSARMIADIEITPEIGKTLAGDSLERVAMDVPGVSDATSVVSDQALAIYRGREMPVRLYAADLDKFRKMTDIDSVIHAPGRYPSSEVDFDKAPEALFSVGAAVRLSVYPSVGSSEQYYPDEPVFIFAPKRRGTINTANPVASFVTDSVAPSGVFESGESEFDAATIILSPEVARPLFMFDDDIATSVIVKTTDSSPHAADVVADRLRARLGDGFDVKTRAEQQQIAFRMVNIEKWVTFLLLIFILLIASFNIISTMTMFVLDKKRDLRILSALGMSRRRVGRVFAWQSAFVTAIGALTGMLLGLILSLLQQYCGFITMGNGADRRPIAYPVRVEWIDFPMLLVPVIVIGLVAAWTASAYARRVLRFEVN